MATDESLHARIDPMWDHVILRNRAVRTDTLRTLAEVWNENPELVAEQIAKLAAVVEQGGPAWDAAVDDVEIDLQMSEAETELDEQQARTLSAELAAAAALTFSARHTATLAAAPITFPTQQNRRHAA